MKRALPFLALILLLVVFQSPLATQAQTIEQSNNEAIDASEDEDDAPVPRVARLSFVKGDVSFLRAGVTDWAAAVENLPLLAGDQLYVGRDARAEVQLANGSYIRLSESTALAITNLTDDAAQFEITEGIAIIKVERLSNAFKRFELDTPNAALLLQDDGLYRVNVRGDDDSEIIVRQGSAEVSTVDGNFKVRQGRKLVVDSSLGGRLEIALDNSTDDWDQWNYERDALITQTYNSSSPDYVTSYETTYNSFYGANDLSNYGSWFNDSDYGYCWRPRASYDWVPYRDGQWLWIPAAGWTWVSHERWGWAPYHYGRWVFIPRYGWSWAPGFIAGRSVRNPWYFGNPYRYYRWRPALVHFYYYQSPRGNYVAWHPLAPNERWHRPDRDRRDNDHSHLRYPAPGGGNRRADDRARGGLPRDTRGISELPVDGFTRSDRSKIRPGAPGREASDWMARSVRPGLPQLNPMPVATAPSVEGTDRFARRIAVPPKEVIGRSVVTRNRPPDSQSGISQPQRERRLLMPRPPESNGSDSRRARKFGNGEDNRNRNQVGNSTGNPADQQDSNENGGRQSRKTPILLPSPVDKNKDGDSTSERVRRRDGNPGQATGENPQDSGSNSERKERRRNRPDDSAAPQETAPNVQQPDENQRRTRERRPPWATPSNPGDNSQQNDQQQREENRRREEKRQRDEQRERDNDSNRGQNRTETPPRNVEPRPERPQPPPESKAERKEEKRQERQQQEERRQEHREERESRRKPNS